MRLKTTLRKLRREKKVVVIVFITFLFVSLGANFTLAGVGSVTKAVRDFTKIGNVEFIVQGVNVENLTRFGEVVNYLYFNEGKVEFNGKEYEALIGYGRFKVPKVESSPKGVFVLSFPEVERGDRIEVNRETYAVLGSYYYLMGEPVVLTREKGSSLYVFMRCNDTEALSNFLMKHTKVVYFTVYRKGQAPYMDTMRSVENFAMSFFYLLLGASLLIIVLISLTHVRGSTREVGILKALGLPHSFVSFLFIGDYLFIALLAYLVGIPIGIWLGYAYMNSHFMPLRPNYAYPLGWDVIIVLIITLILSLPYVYVSHLKPIEALRFTPKKSSSLKFFLVFFMVFLASSSAYFGIRGIENYLSFNYPFNLWAWGSPSKITGLPGEKAGYLSGQEVNGITTEIYFLNYTSSFEKTLIAGRWFKKPDEAVIEFGVAKKLGLKVGDTIRVRLLGEVRTYRVAGISYMNFYDGRAIFLPKVSFVPDGEVFLKVSNPEEWKERLTAQGLKAITVEDLKRQIENNLKLFKTAVYSVMVVIFLISLFALFTLVYLEIEGNEKVYATLKAIGVPNPHVWRGLLRKAVPSLVTASLLALPISLKLGECIGDMVVPAKLGPSDIVKVLPPLAGFYVLYAVFLVVITNRVLNRLDVIKALRS
ncbi:FtsX-like permease family protein [Thermococcus sp.]|uniref:ABC transporter permease n=2 Tax=Thermococcus sp. TaxID=35749 RepID=UPI0026063FD2|nr:FtsX-like permease family protein [Thermococcus sp.]